MTSAFLLERTGNFLATEAYKNNASSLRWWQAVDQPLFRAYSDTLPTHFGASTEIQLITDLKGPNAKEAGLYHYVVETDIPASHEDEFNDWYNTEHLPGL